MQQTAMQCSFLSLNRRILNFQYYSSGIIRRKVKLQLLSDKIVTGTGELELNSKGKRECGDNDIKGARMAGKKWKSG